MLQAYAEPLRSNALHAFYSAYATMPHCQLLNTVAQAKPPDLRHSLLSPRAAHWGLAGHVLQPGGSVCAIALSPDESLIVFGMDWGRLRLWSMVKFEEVVQLVGHHDTVRSVAFSSDGLRIVSGSIDRTIRIWDSRSFEELGLCEHDGQVYSVAFSPDNRLIGSGSADCTLRLWSALTFAEVARLAGHEHTVTSVAFSSDGTRIVSSSYDCTVHMWHARTYEPLPGIQCSGPLWMLVVSPDGTRLALKEAGYESMCTLRVFDMVSLAEQAQVELSHHSEAIAFSTDGNLIASGTESGAVQVWKASDLSNISMIKEHHGQVMAIAFLPNGSQLVSGSLIGTVRIRSVAVSEEQFAPIPGHDDYVSEVAFSNDGSRLVSGSWYHTVRLWNAITCQELAVLTGHEGRVESIAYSPNGTRESACRRARWSACSASCAAD
jgi:WD40 repeat protein